MKRRLYYYGEDVLSKSFLILPKELVFTESLAKMSAKSKILYCVLRERLILSARNNWKDENGRIYLIYSIEKMAQECCRLLLEHIADRNRNTEEMSLRGETVMREST